MVLHARVADVLDRLAAATDHLRETTSGIPAERRVQSPGPGRWTVAEIVSHLAMVEARVGRMLGGHVEAARARGLGPERETEPVAARFDTTRILDRTRRIESGEASQPVNGITAEAAWTAFAEAHAALLATITAADGLALGEIVAANPVLGPLNVYEWVLFLAGHEARHTAQILETAAAREERDARV
jgi:uncharacterized damage-inducible protein DinB